MLLKSSNMRNVFFLLFVFCFADLFSQSVDSVIVTAPFIKTVQFYRSGWDLSYPAIRLQSDEKLELHFDDLESNTTKDYRYEIIHCGTDWEPSPIASSEFLDGFPENIVRNYQYSINTTVPYIHYSLSLPNDDVKFKVSGNYLIKIYDTDSSNPVLVRRFSVYESLINIQAQCIRPLNPAYMATKQQLNIKLSYGLDLPNPAKDIQLIVRQNGNDYGAIANRKPDNVEPGLLDYTFLDGILFNGGNEYRTLDIKSIRYQGLNVASIQFQAPNYHVYLIPEDQNSRKRYFYQEESNGQYIIRNDRGSTANTDADYVYVHFELPYFEEAEGSVYLFGALTNWQIADSFKMRYNFRTQHYELCAQLKQGYYNYQFIFVPKGKSNAESDLKFFENSFYETENDYFVFAYVTKPNERFQRLGGYQIVNSMKK